MFLVLEEIFLKDKSEWCYINMGMVYIDLYDIVMGKVIFVVDVCIFSVLVVVILCLLVVGGIIKNVDSVVVKVIKGVIDVVEIFVFKGVL